MNWTHHTFPKVPTEQWQSGIRSYNSKELNVQSQRSQERSISSDLRLPQHSHTRHGYQPCTKTNAEEKQDTAVTKRLLKPQLNTYVAKQQEHKQQKQAHYYNKGANELSQLKTGYIVRVQPVKYKKTGRKQLLRSSSLQYHTKLQLKLELLFVATGDICDTPKKDFSHQSQNHQMILTFHQPATASQLATSLSAAEQSHPDHQVNLCHRSGRISKQPRYLKDFVIN